MLADFRTGHPEFLDELLTDTIATLMHQGIVTLQKVGQDGMRVRASAGNGSFRREKTLKKCREEAARQVQKLRDESEDESASDASKAGRKAAQEQAAQEQAAQEQAAQEQAAQERAARERLERVNAALENIAELQQQKEKRKQGSGHKARCSMTDPEARNMKMANGGFRPAYNVQFATDGDARVIVSVDVTNNGSDGGQMAPLHKDVCDRYDKVPATYIVDGGFSANDDITTVEQSGSQVVAPMTHEGSHPQSRRRPARTSSTRQRRDGSLP